jgi:hypothetical protein
MISEYAMFITADFSVLTSSQAAEEAHEKLRHQTLQDGVMETDWVFLGDTLIAPGPAMQE